MFEAAPGQTITISQDGLPSGLVVGYQVIKAASDTVSIGRSTAGVVERPAGSGNYVTTFVAPVEADLYLIVIDWNDGAITATTSVVEQLRVTSEAEVASSGLGAVADYAKVYLGAALFDGLLGDANYGSGFIALAIAAVKARLTTTPIDPSVESSLPLAVASYIGKLAALELLPAVRSMVGNWEQSKSKGADPMEVVTYPDRVQIVDRLQDRLLDQVRYEQTLAMSLMPTPVMLEASGPDIDEEDSDRYVTPDPHDFPREWSFPYRDRWLARAWNSPS